MDIDETLAEAARRIHGANVAARLVHADVRALPLESRGVDLVIDFGTRYHVSGGTAGSVSARAAVLWAVRRRSDVR